MIGTGNAAYRLRIARGFLDEARQDVVLGRWRAVMDNAQLAVENAARAVLALLGPVGRTHNPAPLLRQAVGDGTLAGPSSGKVLELAELAELLGFDVHVQNHTGCWASGVARCPICGNFRSCVRSG